MYHRGLDLASETCYVHTDLKSSPYRGAGAGVVLRTCDIIIADEITNIACDLISTNTTSQCHRVTARRSLDLLPLQMQVARYRLLNSRYAFVAQYVMI